MPRKVENVERYAILLHQEGKRKTAVLEARYYGRNGDPANHVKFEIEKPGGSMEAFDVKTKEIERLLQHELDNWIRWGRKRDWMPTSFKSQLGTLYRTIDRETDAPPEKLPLPIVESVAVKMERIVIALPAKHRAAFVMHHLDRAAVRGQIAIVRNRDDKARVLCVAKSRYHELVAQAHNIVWREWIR